MIREAVLATALGIEAAAGLLVGLAAIHSTLRALRSYVGSRKDGQEQEVERVRLRFGRWLLLALEFELGADILRTAVAPTWNDIGLLAAIAFLRTVLNYFLAKEIANTRLGDAGVTSVAP